MARISFPLGFKIIDNQGAADTGQAIDERSVFASSSDRTSYTNNYFYRGLLSYTIGTPYHVSGVSDNSGYYTRYYNGATYSWVGLNAHTVDDKDAYGTMDSSSASTTDPTTGTNIVDHVNYLYTLTSALSTSRTWKAPVSSFSDLASTYPSPSTGWTALVTLENSIYTYDGSDWLKTGGNSPALSSTVSGIVSYVWYDALNDFITAYNDDSTNNKYLNKERYGVINLAVNGVNVGQTTADSTGTFRINATNGITVTSPYNNEVIISAGSASLSIPDGRIPYGTGTGYDTSANLLYNYSEGYLNINNGVNTVAINADTSGYFPIVNNTNTILSTGFSFENTYSVERSVLIGSDLINQQANISNSVLIGNSVGYSLSEDTLTNRFLLSTSTDNGSSESNLLDGTFPATGLSDSYGSLKLRGSLSIKENDCVINRTTGTTTDLTFTDPHAGTVTLYELLSSSPNDGILDWNSSTRLYEPYSSHQSTPSLSTTGSAYSGSPHGITLNYNGEFICGSTNAGYASYGIKAYSYGQDSIYSLSTSGNGVTSISDTGIGIFAASYQNSAVYADSGDTNGPAIYATNTTSNIAIDTAGEIRENGNRLVAVQTGNSGKVLSTNGTRTEWIATTSSTQYLLNTYYYYRDTLDVDTSGDIRIEYTTVSRTTWQYNGATWVIKEVLEF